MCLASEKFLIGRVGAGTWGLGMERTIIFSFRSLHKYMYLVWSMYMEPSHLATPYPDGPTRVSKVPSQRLQLIFKIDVFYYYYY